MVQGLPDLLLPAKALQQHRVRFHLGMRNFHRDGPAGVKVRGAIKHAHAAARGGGLQPVVIENVAGLKHCG